VLGYSLALVGAICSAFAITHLSFWQFCLGATLMGMGRGISEQTRYAGAEVYPPSQRAKIIGLLVWAGTIGSVAGPLLVEPTGSLAAAYGFDVQTGPFWAAALISALAVLLTYVFLRPDPLVISKHLGHHTGAPQAEGQPGGSVRPMSEIFASNRLRLAVASLVIGQLVMTMIMVITPLHMDHHHHDIKAISWVLMGHTLGMFALAPVTGWLIDRLGRTSMIMLGGIVLILSSVITPLSNDMLFLAGALFLLGLGWNFTFIAGSSLMSDSLAPNERGRAQGFSESLVALASGVGSLGTGAAFAYGGILLVSAIGLACSLAFVAGSMWLNQRQEPVLAGKLADDG
jgi:MFS family permease